MLSTVNAVVRRSWLLDSVRRLSLTHARCSNQNSDGDDSKNKAKLKLNALLETIIKDDSLAKQDHPKQETAPRPKLREKRAKERTERNLGEKMVNAAKEVAKKIEGDQSKTEAELLSRVVARDETLQKSVLRASGKSTLNLLLAELEVEKSQSRHKRRSTLESLKQRDERSGDFSRADMMGSGRPRPQTRWTGPPVKGQAVDIFGGRPLGIFKPTGKYESGPELHTWDQCSARELKIAFTHPPRNIWEQMIQWTDKGMLWKFPIDNEQGLEKEQEVSFVDHIFLDVHLEDWCPKRGPIRNYMELVCVGLSRNHWLSVEEKKDHILWYKEYFLSKKQLIKELEAGEFIESGETSANT